MEGRIQQCSIDLTHKADKELVDELIKQRELAEADKPASVATDESFNEHDLALRVAINNSISELGRCISAAAFNSACATACVVVSTSASAAAVHLCLP